MHAAAHPHPHCTRIPLPEPPPPIPPPPRPPPLTPSPTTVPSTDDSLRRSETMFLPARPSPSLPLGKEILDAGGQLVSDGYVGRSTSRPLFFNALGSALCSPERSSTSAAVLPRSPPPSSSAQVAAAVVLSPARRRHRPSLLSSTQVAAVFVLAKVAIVLYLGRRPSLPCPRARGKHCPRSGCQSQPPQVSSTACCCFAPLMAPASHSSCWCSPPPLTMTQENPSPGV